MIHPTCRMVPPKLRFSDFVFLFSRFQIFLDLQQLLGWRNLRKETNIIYDGKPHDEDVKSKSKVGTTDATDNYQHKECVS